MGKLDLNIRTVIDLSPDDLDIIIAEYLEGLGYVVTGNGIEYKVQRYYIDREESKEEIKFNGARVSVRDTGGI